MTAQCVCVCVCVSTSIQKIGKLLMPFSVWGCSAYVLYTVHCTLYSVHVGWWFIKRLSPTQQTHYQHLLIVFQHFFVDIQCIYRVVHVSMTANKNERVHRFNLKLLCCWALSLRRYFIINGKSNWPWVQR